MTPNDLPAFERLFTMLATTLQLAPSRMTPEMPAWYFQALADMPLEAVRQAAVNLARGDDDRRDVGWFPTAPQWRREAQDVLKERAAARESARLKQLTEGVEPPSPETLAKLEALKAQIGQAVKPMPTGRYLDLVMPSRCESCGVGPEVPEHRPGCVVAASARRLHEIQRQGQAG